MQGHKSSVPVRHSLPSDMRQAFEDFTTIVAHDLNAPLRIISSFSQLLEQRYGTALDDRGLHYIDRIHETSRQAQARLAALLQYSRLSTEPMVFAAVNCNLLVDSCVQHFQDDIDARGISISVGVLPTITADSERLSLLLYSLISNAVKFSRSIAPRIEIDATPEENSWRFCVRDNGPGIGAEHQEAVFQIFRRLPGGDQSGLGMGLTLGRRIAELHGGRLWVESIPGEGARFYFTITDSGDDHV